MDSIGWVIDTARSVRKSEGGEKSLFPTSSSQQEVEGGETVRLPDKPITPSSSGSAAVPRAVDGGTENKDASSDKLVEDLLRRIARDATVQKYSGNDGDEAPDSQRTTSTRDKIESNGQDKRHQGQRHRHRHLEKSRYGYNSRLPRGRLESDLETRLMRDREAEGEGSRSLEQCPVDGRASRPDYVPAAANRVAAALANGQPRIAEGGRQHGDASSSSIVDAEAEPFTEVMWENSSCRQVLQAMFFGPDSAIPAGRGEEYKELEEFVPKFLARRAQAAKASASKRPSVQTGAPAHGTPLESSNGGIPADRPETASTSRRLPPAISALPSAFHKRYLMNFTVLSPEQQRVARESERAAQGHRSGNRNRLAGWRGHKAERRWADLPGSDRGEATLLRELSRQGVLEREEVKAMLRTGPLQDFRGNVLQAFIDFRMRKSLAKVIKIRGDRAALPIAAYQDAIVKAVASNPCVLVAGDTGCGKSTQVPQFLLQAGYGRVACTQPRRISAMGLCRRVSYEMLHEHGSEVAYQVRFDSSRRKSSRILFLTEGLLLRQIASDPDLSAYSVIIVDEVHERHAGCDFLLGLLRAVLRRRADLKVVLMSATINPELFSRFFDGAPLIRVPGRMHTVEVRYVPTAADDDIQEAISKHDGEGQRKLRTRRAGAGGKRVIFDARPYVKLLETIDTTTPRDERGDLLVFLSGMSDMLAVSEGVREFVEAKNPRRWVVLMLHSSLSIEEQDKVFDAASLGTRKMILATNIAETSVTIDGIRFVADSGKAKEMSWDPTSGVRSLQEFWVSRASAEQRKGRAGRTGPGVCFRLYARETFDRLSPFAEPEIRRCPLEDLILQMKSLGLADPRRFPYLSPPPPENLTAALEALALLGATDAAKDINDGDPMARPEEHSLEPSRQTGAGDCDGGLVFADAIARAPLTPLGRLLSSLPVEPSVGKMLALASLFGEIEHVLTLAAALSTQTPFEARSAGSSASSGVNPVAEFASPDGDPFTVMNAYDEWIRVKADRRESSRRWCKRRGLQEQRLYEITKLRRQFQDLLADSGLLWLGAAAERARQRGLAHRGQGRGKMTKDKLHELKMKRGGRKRKVLQVEVSVGADGGGRGEGTLVGVEAEAEAKAKAEAEEDERDLRAEVGEGGTDGGDDGMDLSSLEFYMAQNVDQLAESSRRRLTRRDVSVTKAILCQGLYPNFAVADAGNSGRPSNERQYVTRSSGGLFMSPSSVLACQDFGEGADDRRRSTTSTPRNMASSGAVTRAGRGDGLLCYGSVMETQRPFLSSVTPLPALQALLLFSARIDTSEDASLMLFDHWLLVEMRGKDPAFIGQKLLAVACGLRARLKALLSGALMEAERRRRTSIAVPGGSECEFIKNSKARMDDGPEDLPPLLIVARQAWFDGERLGEDESGEKGTAEQKQTVDWAQEAEDLSVELADFMLQPVGYDVKSISPRQVEALIVDSLRLSEPAELRRILHGARGWGERIEEDRGVGGKGSSRASGKNGINWEDIPEALSRAVEEEVRGTKGLFGLDSGVLERLKSGVRLTPFLRHGSLRRRDPDRAAPGGLAGGGLKKWWRCPRCHLSQVVDLEAIHKHFKVCLVDAGSGAPGREKGGTPGGAPSDDREGQPKRLRMLGTSVKTGRPRSLPKERTRREDEG